MKAITANVWIKTARSVAAAAFMFGFPLSDALAADDVETVLKNYLHAFYSRDAAKAYDLLSAADREVKTLKEYAQETGSFDGTALELSKALADNIQFDNFVVHVVDGLAHVTFDVTLPNANDPVLRESLLGFDSSRLQALTFDQVEALKLDLYAKSTAGKLPVLSSDDETWSMIKEDGQWRVFLNWADAVEVKFNAMTFHDLGWEFEPVQPRVMAKHGETVQMAYRAKNVGTSDVTGKAQHIIGPEDDADYLEIITCFCFLESTLAPGEEVELPLTFRVDYDAPEDITKFWVTYEFYPADRFPNDEQANPQVQG